MSEHDLPPTHRHKWRLWLEPGYALDEWWALASLSEELERAAELLDGIRRGLRGTMPGGERIGWMTRSLARMSDRWRRRADAARLDAITDYGRDPDWIERQEGRIGEHLAVAVLARGLNDVEKAERFLSRDTATAQRIRNLREQLDAVYAEVHERDPVRDSH